MRAPLFLPLLILAPLALVACGEKDDDDDTGTGTGTDTDGGTDTDADTDTDGSTDTDSDGGTGDGCEALDPDSCATRDDCAVITARKVVEVDGIECIDWDAAPTPVGCMDAEMGCDDAVYLATGPGEDEGSCNWWFSNGCIPDGYTVCSSDTREDCPD
ncbi:MAG: hypothetical protein H6742_09025 [Alphaproteobacteria bacterium]|nr:hypothetical protein [Alphaproteobacteria bacterium]